MVLGAVSVGAAELGLASGMTLADARARVPNLLSLTHDPAADRHFLRGLAGGCHAFSPRVAVDAPDGLTLDIAGVEHLFGGEAAMIAAVEAHFDALALSTQIAVANTADGAAALAKFGGGSGADEHAALRALPVEALGLDADATISLRRAGLKRIGDIATRPSATIAARFGMGAVASLERLLGHQSAPIDTIPHTAPMLFERRFAEPVGHSAAIATAMLTLLEAAAEALRERGLGGRKYGLTLYRSDGAKHRLAIATGAPTRDPARVMRLFEERVAALADPLDPGFGYDSMTLRVTAAEALPDAQAALDGSERAETALADLIDRLATRLGDGAIRRLIPRDSHLPEQAQLALPVVEARAPVRWPTPPSGEPPLRPLFLFDPPQSVEVVAEVPDGPPHRFRWRRKLHEVRLYEGPERIAPEWWRHKGGEISGKGALTRDYYRVEDARGRRYWLFRHGLYEEKSGPKWYVHGMFA
jgi:protein ImuB